ncbi:MAG: response regulator [Verrucomicrobiales bacterium]
MTSCVNLLLIEDSDDDIFFMQRALKAEGFQPPCHISRDGQNALDYLNGKGVFEDRSKYPLPQLILLDLKLPKVLGMDVLKYLRGRSEFDGIVIVVLTSSADQAEIDRAYSLGANSYLVKPPQPDELRQLVAGLRSFLPVAS